MFPKRLENKFSIHNITYKIEIFSLMYYFPQWVSREFIGQETSQDAKRREWIINGLKNLPNLGKSYENSFFLKTTCYLIAKYLKKEMNLEFDNFNKLGLVVIPPSKIKTKSGLNLIVDYLSRRYRGFVNLSDLIIKIHDTQKGKKKNIHEVFESLALNQEILNSKEFRELNHIIVLDDVTTTGASMTAACHLLRNPDVRQERYFLAIGRTLNLDEIKNKKLTRFKNGKSIYFPQLTDLDVVDEEKNLFKESLRNVWPENYARPGEGNAYNPWTDLEAKKLLDLYLNGFDLETLTKRFKRSEGAIRSRLMKLGAIKDES